MAVAALAASLGLASCQAAAVPSTTGVSECGWPASYRVNGGPSQWLGDCAAGFYLPAPAVTVSIGQEIDIHMTQMGSGASGTILVPEYPVPTSTNSQALARTSITDGDSSASFQARSNGLAQLETVGGCPSESSSSYCTILSVIVIG